MRRSDLLVALALALAAAALYAPTLGYDFTDWDDTEYVLQNPLIRAIDPGSLGAIFSHFYLANYAPLHLTSYAFLYAAAGPAPWVFHAMNLLLHALCVSLVFVLLRRLDIGRAAAAFGAALFLAHPAQVEAVAWVNQTKTLLATAFGLGALLLLLRYRRLRPGGEGASREGSAWLAYCGAVALFACALLSKPQAVAFPGIFFCVEQSLADRGRRLRIAHWMPFVLVAALIAWIGVAAQGSLGAVKAYGPLGLAGNVFRSAVILVDYLRITFLPVDLSVLYEVEHLRTLLDGRFLASALILGAVALAAWRGRASAGRPWHALGAWVAPLVPVLGWVPLNVPMADRYLYPALFALAWFAGGAWHALPRPARATLWAVPVLF
ncbi:MAG: hypothetical protein Q8R92_02380, partial [Deltaproteobacteria bacterium]|nr:hypothetical protein [Deltaproteobacteria bacterium]